MASRRTQEVPRQSVFASRAPLEVLPVRDRGGDLHVVVDTPRGSGIKFKFDAEKTCYTISHVLPTDLVFPFDFGSIPRTAAADGDPLDVVLVMEAPSFPGCLVRARLIGALEAKQTQEGKTLRNDRLIAVASESRVYKSVRALADLRREMLEEFESFFVTYNERRGRHFRIVRRVGSKAAHRLVAEGERKYRKRHGA